MKKILPIMVAAGCVTQWYSGSLEASFKDRQAGRWGWAGPRPGAYPSDSFSFASNEIRVGEFRDREKKGPKAENVYSTYGETSSPIFRDKLILQIVFSGLDR